MAKASVSRPPPDAEAQRVKLFQAQGIVEVVRYSVDSRLEGLHETAITHALQVASRIIDDVAAALEGTSEGAA
jgi:hypothetical protein